LGLLVIQAFALPAVVTALMSEIWMWVLGFCSSFFNRQARRRTLRSPPNHPVGSARRSTCLTFFTMLAFWATNEVARDIVSSAAFLELPIEAKKQPRNQPIAHRQRPILKLQESPFLYAPNDLPLVRVAHSFCERLLATSAATAAAAEAGVLAWDGAALDAPVL
jgi:hypothetical protein